MFVCLFVVVVVVVEYSNEENQTESSGHFTHERLRAHDHYTLIGGKGGAGPSSLHTTLEGPTEYVNARWM